MKWVNAFFDHFANDMFMREKKIAGRGTALKWNAKKLSHLDCVNIRKDYKQLGKLLLESGHLMSLSSITNEEILCHAPVHSEF